MGSYALTQNTTDVHATTFGLSDIEAQYLGANSITGNGNALTVTDYGAVAAGAAAAKDTAMEALRISRDALTSSAGGSAATAAAAIDGMRSAAESALAGMKGTQADAYKFASGSNKDALFTVQDVTGDAFGFAGTANKDALSVVRNTTVDAFALVDAANSRAAQAAAQGQAAAESAMGMISNVARDQDSVTMETLIKYGSFALAAISVALMLRGKI